MKMIRIAIDNVSLQQRLSEPVVLEIVARPLDSAEDCGALLASNRSTPFILMQAPPESETLILVAKDKTGNIVASFLDRDGKHWQQVSDAVDVAELIQERTGAL